MYLNCQNKFYQANEFVGEISHPTVKNWLEQFFEVPYTKEFLKKLQNQGIETITILKFIQVEWGEKGKGHGRQGLQEFVSQAQGPIFLVAEENQDNSFDLAAWYQRYDFHEYESTKFGPMMVRGL